METYKSRAQVSSWKYKSDVQETSQAWRCKLRSNQCMDGIKRDEYKRNDFKVSMGGEESGNPRTPWCLSEITQSSVSYRRKAG